jgi:hypothetical protein
VAQHLFQSPRVANQRSSLDLDYTVVSTRLDNPAVQTRWPKDATDSSFVKCESVRHDQRDTSEIHSTGYILKEGERVSVASSSYDSRRPEPRPDVNRGEDPDRMFFVSDDRLKLVCLKLYDGECSYFSIVEPTTKATFEPAIDGIPGYPLYARDSKSSPDEVYRTTVKTAGHKSVARSFWSRAEWPGGALRASRLGSRRGAVPQRRKASGG